MNIGTLWAHLGLDNSHFMHAADESEQRVHHLSASFVSMAGAVATGMMAFQAIAEAGKAVAEVFMSGIEAVDSFKLSVAKMSAMLASFKTDGDIKENYRMAKEYAEGLEVALMGVDAQTTLNLENLHSMTEEMIKQRIQLDYNNAAEVEGFTRIANAVAMYSRNGQDERQLRQELRSLLMGEVNINSQLAMMLQKVVKGPLAEMVSMWKQQGILIPKLGEALAGFGEGSKDIAGTWSAVSSSFKTSTMLLQRAVFAKPFEDLVNVLNSANTYLKEHYKEIAGHIVPIYETLRTVVGTSGQIMLSVLKNTSIYAFAATAAFVYLASAVNPVGASLIFITGAIAAYQAGIQGVLNPEVAGLLMLVSALTALTVIVPLATTAMAGLSAAWATFTGLVVASFATNPIGWFILLAGSVAMATNALLQYFAASGSSSGKMQPMSSHKESFKIDIIKAPEDWARETKQAEAEFAAMKSMQDASLAQLKSHNAARKIALDERYQSELMNTSKHYRDLTSLEAQEMTKQMQGYQTMSEALTNITTGSKGASYAERLVATKKYYTDLAQLELAEIGRQVTNAKKQRTYLSEIYAGTLAEKFMNKNDPAVIAAESAMAKNAMEVQKLYIDAGTARLTQAKNIREAELKLNQDILQSVQQVKDAYVNMAAEIPTLMGDELGGKLAQVENSYASLINQTNALKMLTKDKTQLAFYDEMLVKIAQMIGLKKYFAEMDWDVKMDQVRSQWNETMGYLEESARLKNKIETINAESWLAKAPKDVTEMFFQLQKVALLKAKFDRTQGVTDALGQAYLAGILNPLEKEQETIRLNYDKQIAWLRILRDEKIATNQNASDETIKILALEAQRRAELEKLTPSGTYWQGMQEGAKQYIQSLGTMYQQGIEMSRSAAQAMQSNLSNFFFDAFTGKLKTVWDYLSAFRDSVMRIFADVLSQQLVAAFLEQLGTTKSKLVTTNGLEAATTTTLTGAMTAQIAAVTGLTSSYYALAAAKLAAGVLGSAGGGGSGGGMMGMGVNSMDLGTNGGVGVMGSFAEGTDFVNQTGPYLLHRGESVNTAEETAAGGKGGNTIHHWHVQAMDAKSFVAFAMENRETFALVQGSLFSDNSPARKGGRK